MLTQKKDVWIILVIGLAFSLAFMSTQIMVVDSMQLLERGFMLTKGYLVPFGPKSTHSNLIYGSFISLFTGFFLKIYNHTFTVLIGIALFHLLGFWILTRIQFLKQSPQFYFIYLFLVWCSPWRASEVFIWNPSFIFTLSILYLYSIDLFLRNKRFYGTIIQGLAILVCAQVHNSFIFLIILSFGLWYRSIIKPHWWAVTICFFFAFLSMIPTLLVLNSHPELLEINRQKGTHLFSNLLNGGEALKGILYWLRYPSLYLSSTIFKNRDFSNIFLTNLWFVTKWICASLSILIIVFANIRFFRGVVKNHILKVLASTAFLSLVLTSCISPVPFNYWHLYLIYPFAIIPVAYCLSEAKYFHKIVWGIGTYFVLSVFIGSHWSQEHLWDTSLNKDYQKTIALGENQLMTKFHVMYLDLREIRK